jgi:hypothetical protein
VTTFLTTSLSAKGEVELLAKQDDSDNSKEKVQFLESIAPNKEKKEEPANTNNTTGPRPHAGTTIVPSSSHQQDLLRAQTGLSVILKSGQTRATTTSEGVGKGPKGSSENKKENENEAGGGEEAVVATQEEVRLPKAVGLYEFEPQSEKELALKVDDVIVVHDMTGDSWWFGTVDGTTFGYFPNNYVRLLPEAEW